MRGKLPMSERVAVVVAGGSGMGAAAARKLAQEGFKVAILSASGKGETLGKELDGIGVTGSNQSIDDLTRLVDLTLDRWGRIDVLVNLSLIHISEPTRLLSISYAVFCL